LDLRTILAAPAAYRLFTRLIAGNCRAVYALEYIRPTAGDRILDIGCGPGDILDYLPEVRYLGVDLSARYIAAARARFGDRGEFRCQALKDLVIDEPASYDKVLANGVVHHLDDEEAAELFRLARLALKPGGRLITMDGCFVPGQSAVASALLRRDRGEFVRTAEAYIGLAGMAFAAVRASVRHDLLRVPYTHLILECTAGLSDD
jgi:SAM-dependent methyltransferase